MIDTSDIDTSDSTTLAAYPYQTPRERPDEVFAALAEHHGGNVVVLTRLDIQVMWSDTVAAIARAKGIAERVFVAIVDRRADEVRLMWQPAARRSN